MSCKAQSFIYQLDRFGIIILGDQYILWNHYPIVMIQKLNIWLLGLFNVKCYSSDVFHYRTLKAFRSS